ncbi:BamA/TamA family outer membrane protein [Hyphobacterium sp. HN65]|uniref:Translocation and assembly module subunit TamA n=1 Tax=Hyphobacterium lacteum TaxID=3116575 RepID=A0ABU7LP48_9PROT|nr:BamA/TamA family outer membrane protein [Hyphobacterium sp. HN65]MEE2525658.1 BamA/TamA family outer membrane protein [Hyphobacterium sp. HN65]
MISRVLILLVFFAAPAWSDGPLARLEGIPDPALESALYSVLGESKADADDDIALRRDLRSARDRAMRFLRASGYYAAEIDAEIGDDRQPVLTFRIGPIFTLGEMDIETGAPDSDIIVAEALDHQLREALTADGVLEAEAMGLAALRNAGWPEARPLERSVVIDHARTEGDVIFRYAPGLFTRFGGVILQSEGWRPGYIARLAGLDEGEPARFDALEAFDARLEGLASVRDAQVRLGSIDGDLRPLLVELERAPRHAVEATLSASTTEGAGIAAAWSRRNLFGGDETLTLSAELATLTQLLTAELAIPYWRRLDQRLIITSGLRSEDTDAYQQDEIGAGFSLFRELTDDLDLRLGANGDFSRVTDATGVRDITSLRFNSTLALDQRDDPLDPHSGVLAAVIVNPGFSFGDTSANYVQTEFRGSTYYPFSEHLSAALRVRFGSIIGASASELAADQRFYAGGGGSARGFEYQSLSPTGSNGAPFGGLSVTELNAELRWRGEGRWGAVAFVDTAFASASRTPDFGDLRTGVGLGLRYHFDFAPVRFDVATPLDRRSGEDPVHVYISLGQAF